eukprot:289882_1
MAQQVVRPQPRLPALAAVAFMGKTRTLLHLKKFLKETKQNEFEGFVLNTIDLLNEKLASKSSKQYLGLICRPVDTYQIYGYVTNTNIAIIAVIKNVNIKESEVKQMLSSLHDEYIRYIANPFTIYGQKILSTEFSYRVQ